ncbi:MAG TPA: helix-turn-helix transcriptional regulator, partial [Hydrogenophaga sp.]
MREAREATGLHIAALAAALKVPVKKLDALESGRYEELPDLTFARALASSACRHLKIDPAGVLALIPHAHAPTLGGTSPGVNAPFRPDQGAATSMDAMGWFKKPAVWASALIVLAAAGVALVPDWDEWPGKDLITNATTWFDGVPDAGGGVIQTEVVVPVAVQP